MKRVLAALAMMLFMAAGSAPAATVAEWDTTGALGTELSIAGSGSVNVIADSLVRGSGLTPSSAANNFGAVGWNGTDPNDYYQFGISVANGYTTTLNELWISTRSSSTGPGTIGVYTSLDNYANPVYSITQPSAVYVNSKIDLSSLGAIVGAFSIRLMEIGDTAANGYPTAGTGTFRAGDYYDGSAFQDIILTGDTTPLPTPIPAAAWLLGSGLLGLAGIRRRRQ